MYAIIEIAGQQFKAEKEQEMFVYRLKNNVGDTVELEKVLLLEDEEDNVLIGSPYLKGAKVIVKILDHVRGDKTLILKKKRRKSFRKVTGHRQNFTKILVEDIKQG